MRWNRFSRLVQLLPVLAVLGLALAACGGTKPLLGPIEIDDIRLEGVNRFSKSKLLSHLFAGETSWVPLTPDYPFDEALLAADMRRIEELYKAYGYYQARVTGLQVLRDEHEVDLVLTVEEGEPTCVRRLSFEWEPDAPLDEAARLAVQKHAALVPDGPFEQPAMNDSIGALRQAMLLRGHPLARVTASAVVREATRLADVVFKLRPGPFARIGTIHFQGLDKVPRYMLEREVRFALGEPYSPARVRQVEAALRGMRVFRWVGAQPAEKVTDGNLELVIRLSEADPHSIRVGVEASFETIRWQQQARLGYTHTNLFGHLTRLDLDVVAGWAELPDPIDIQQHGPVAAVVPRFTKKGLLEDHLLWSLVPAFGLNIQEGYQYYSPSNRLGVSRWFAGLLRLGLSHTVRMVDFFNVSPTLDANASLLGRDFRDPFVLSYLEFQAEAYFANSITDPTDGVILDATYAIAGSWLGSGYDFHQILGGLRAYWKPWSRLQIAFQMKTGMLIPYGEEGSSPFSHRLYLGGATTVRGWGSRRISPRVEECADDGTLCDTVPIGGLTLIQANLELRLHLFWWIGVVAFADMGDVQAEALTWAPEEWNFTAGGGLRVDSPLGIIRLDFGYRLNDPGVYDEGKMWGLHFGLGETF